MKKILLGISITFFSLISKATTVEMTTSQGVIEINLFDQQTPKTVANFLNYVKRDAYNQTVIHRSIPGFIIQGGGFTFSDSLDPIDTDLAVVNEPVLSNVKGTIAMAKVSGNENSATSQWFFNIADNSTNLDVQNNGFTVFGQISAQSQPVLDKITALVHCESLPVVEITTAQCADSNVTLSVANLVVIESVVVIDDDPASSQNLAPIENTLIKSVLKTSSSESGSVVWLLGAVLFVFSRRNNKMRQML